VSDATTIRVAHQRSDGWVAGLILLLGPSAARPSEAILAPSSQSLSHYFSAIFDHELSEKTRGVLLSTAFAGGITGRLAALLSGQPDAERVLEELHASNCFIDRRAGGEPAFVLHALFRTFLLDHLGRQVAPDDRVRQMRKTAEALRDTGEHEAAAMLFCEAGDWQPALALVLAMAPRLLSQGRWQTLQERVKAFPPELPEAAPWLQYWLGASQMAVDPIAACTTLARAFDAFAGKQDEVGQMIAAATIIEAQFLLFTEFTTTDRWIEALVTLLARGERLPDVESELRVYAALVQALSLRQPWHPELPAFAQRALALARGDATPATRILAATAVAYHMAWIGNMAVASEATAIARSLLARPDVLPLHRVWVRMALAYVSYTRADHDEGDALFARAFAIVEEFGFGFLVLWMRGADCWRRLDRGELKAVASNLRTLEGTRASGRGVGAAHLNHVRGWLALLEGNNVLARQEVETAAALGEQAGSIYTLSFNWTVLIEALIELGEHGEAEAYIARFGERFGGVEGAMLEFQRLLLEAYLALRQHDESRLASVLRTAFAIGRTHGYVATLCWYAPMMARLCAFALEHDIEPDYARMLVRRRRLAPDAPLECWPWPVKIRTLGRFEIARDGEQLRSEGKAQHKPIALAKVLAASGEHGVPVDRLIDVLWPDPSEGDGHKAFDITVHRLRKLLGADDAIRVADRHAALDARVVWVDAWALERTLAPLVGATNALAPPIALLEAAAPAVLGLYQGRFLAGETEEAWQVPIVNRLAGRFQRFVLRLGEHWETHQEWRRAAELYQRAVEIDPLAETFYRRQMICLQAQGRRAEALEVFRRCRQALSISLGVAPTTETLAAYRQLLAQ
jgi:DNA-binding SARP family transcriptional activator